MSSAKKRRELNRGKKEHDLARLLLLSAEARVNFQRLAESIMGQHINELEAKLAAAQAKIDELMLEYYPEEMTPEQIAEWGRNQEAC